MALIERDFFVVSNSERTADDQRNIAKILEVLANKPILDSEIAVASEISTPKASGIIEQSEFSDSFEDFVCSNFSAGELFELIQTKKTCKEVLDELNELFIEELKNEEEDEEDED